MKDNKGKNITFIRIAGDCSFLGFTVVSSRKVVESSNRCTNKVCEGFVSN